MIIGTERSCIVQPYQMDRLDRACVKRNNQVDEQSVEGLMFEWERLPKQDQAKNTEAWNSGQGHG